MRRLPWVAAALLLLAACSGGPPDLVTQPTAPPNGSAGLHRAARTVPTVAGLPPSPWGTVPVEAPARLRATAAAYYAQGGPQPDNPWKGAPACLLLLPTALGPNLAPVPSTRFDLLGHFLVTWRLATGRGAGLTLSVVQPGDPSDQPYFQTGAGVTTFSDGSQLRTPPGQPDRLLVRIPIENCEYELQATAGLTASLDAAVVPWLRLIYAPS